MDRTTCNQVGVSVQVLCSILPSFLSLPTARCSLSEDFVKQLLTVRHFGSLHEN